MPAKTNIIKKINLTKKAEAYFKARDLANALASYDELIAYDLNNIDAYLYKAILLIDFLKNDDAHNCLKEALNKNKKNVSAWVLFGIYCLFCDDNESAEKSIDYALKLDDENELAVVGAAYLLKINKDDDALTAFYNATNDTNKYNSNIFAILAMAEIYLDKKDYEKALETVDLALNDDPNNIRALHIKTKVLVELEHYEEALKCNSLVLKFVAQYPEAELYQAKILYWQLKYAEAEEKFSGLYKTNKTYQGEIAHFLGQLLLKKASYTEANNYIKEAVKLFENPHLARKLEITTLYHKGDYKEALSKIEVALKDKPKNKEILLLKANVLCQQEKYEEASKLYDTLLKNHKDDNFIARVDSAQGFLYLLQKDVNKAEESFEKVLAKFNGSLAMQGKGLVNYLRKDFLQAKNTLEILEKNSPAGVYALDARILLFLLTGKVLLVWKDYRKAYEYYHRITILKPDYEPAYIIHHAAQQGQIPKLEYLLTNNEIANLTDYRGESPLMRAASYDKPKTSLFLIQNNAFVGLVNKQLHTAMEIAYEKKNFDVLIILLKERQDYLEYFDKIYQTCKINYQGTFNFRKKDAELLDESAKLLTGENINKLREQHRYKHIAHNNSLSGAIGKKVITNPDKTLTVQEGESLTGWYSENFLPLRIRHLFELIIQIDTGKISVQDLPSPNKEIIIDKLKQELLVELETLRTRKDALIIQKIKDQQIKENCIKSHVYNIANKITNLTEGNEYCYNSGYIGHSVYINFVREKNNIIIRIDNLGGGGSKHEMITRDNKQDISTQYRQPFIVGIVSRKEFLNLSRPVLTYLQAIFQAKFDEKDIAVSKIYSDTWKNTRPVQNPWPHKKTQGTGNCVVKNHHAGQQFRLFFQLNPEDKRGKTLYKWVINKENQMAINKDADFEQDIIDERLPTILSKMNIS